MAKSELHMQPNLYDPISVCYYHGCINLSKILAERSDSGPLVKAGLLLWIIFSFFNATLKEEHFISYHTNHFEAIRPPVFLHHNHHSVRRMWQSDTAKKCRIWQSDKLNSMLNSCRSKETAVSKEGIMIVSLSRMSIPVFAFKTDMCQIIKWDLFVCLGLSIHFP